MLPKTRHKGRRLRAGALTLTISAFIPLAIPLTASASTISPAFQQPPGNYLSYASDGEFYNDVNADSLVSQKTVFNVNFQLGQGVSPNIEAINRVTALDSRCDNCNAIAIGFQVVTTTEQDLNSIHAINLATATNDQCSGTCSASALAYQVVVATDTSQPMTFGNLLTSTELNALLKIRSQVDALPGSGLPVAQIQTDCQNLANQAQTILQSATYTGPNDPTGPGYTGDTRATFSPALRGAGTSTDPSGTDQPLVNLYRDVQFKPFSG